MSGGVRERSRKLFQYRQGASFCSCDTVTQKWNGVSLCQGLLYFAIVRPFINKQLGD